MFHPYFHRRLVIFLFLAGLYWRYLHFSCRHVITVMLSIYPVKVLDGCQLSWIQPENFSACLLTNLPTCLPTCLLANCMRDCLLIYTHLSTYLYVHLPPRLPDHLSTCQHGYIPIVHMYLPTCVERELAVREQCFVSTKETDDRPSRRCVFPFIYKGVLYQVRGNRGRPPCRTGSAGVLYQIKGNKSTLPGQSQQGSSTR